MGGVWGVHLPKGNSALTVLGKAGCWVSLGPHPLMYGRRVE